MNEEARKCVEALRMCPVPGFGCCDCPVYIPGQTCQNELKAAGLIESLSAQLDQVTRERDAAESNKFQYETGFVKGFESAYPKWNSVKEGLPEPGDKILIAFPHSILGFTLHAGEYTGEIWWMESAIIDTPPYWMPLPEPPKEDE